MRKGTDFEVSRDVFDRAKANAINQTGKSFYVTEDDKEKLFSEAVRWGYGLYNCMVTDVDGKYMVSYWTGDSCD